MKIQKLVVAISVALGLALCGTTAAVAQEGGGAEKQGTSTVILKFKSRKVSQDVMDTFYRTLAEEVNKSDEMHTVEGGDVTIEEMIVTAGCQEPTEKCLSGLKDFVDGDRMIFGSIKRSGEAYLFTFRMFDFVEERFVRSVSEQTVEGDEATVKKAIPGIVQGFMHGDVGILKVSASGASGDVRVFFDGEKMGLVPTTLENLPLGQHAVTVKTKDGTEKTKLVLLRKDEQQTVEFDIGPKEVATGSDTGGGGGRGAPILGYSAAGVGVAGLTVGIIGHVQNSQAVQASNELSCNGGDSICNPPGDEERSAEELGQLAEERDKRVTNTAIVSTVGYSVGVLGLGAGSYLLYRHYSGGSGGSSGTQKAEVESVRIQPTQTGLELGVSLSF